MVLQTVTRPLHFDHFITLVRLSRIGEKPDQIRKAATMLPDIQQQATEQAFQIRRWQTVQRQAQQFLGDDRPDDERIVVPCLAR